MMFQRILNLMMILVNQKNESDSGNDSSSKTSTLSLEATRCKSAPTDCHQRNSDKDSVNDSSSTRSSSSYKTSKSESSLHKSTRTLCNQDKSSTHIGNIISVSHRNCLVNKNLVKIPIKRKLCKIKKFHKLPMKEISKIKKVKKTQIILL